MSGMKRYQNPDLYERLSAEYALGTMQGKARKRFERLMHERPYIRYAVEVWENRLCSQGQGMPEVKPDASVWKNIQAEIGGPVNATVGVSETTEGGSGSWFSNLWSSAGLWRTATAFALVLGISPFLLSNVQKEESLEMPSYVAVLESEAKEPMMVTMGDMSKRLVSVRMMQVPDIQKDQDIQLWALHEPNSPPVPVGLVNVDNMETHFKLSPPQWSEMEGARTFAITFEPKGGAPEGQPTGKMMYKGQCLDFI